jgi:hypothetical protein
MGLGLRHIWDIFEKFHVELSLWQLALTDLPILYPVLLQPTVSFLPLENMESQNKQPS